MGDGGHNERTEVQKNRPFTRESVILHPGCCRRVERGSLKSVTSAPSFDYSHLLGIMHMQQQSNSDSTAKDIQVLGGLEAVRVRAGM